MCLGQEHASRPPRLSPRTDREGSLGGMHPRRMPVTWSWPCRAQTKGGVPAGPEPQGRERHSCLKAATEGLLRRVGPLLLFPPRSLSPQRQHEMPASRTPHPQKDHSAKSRVFLKIQSRGSPMSVKLPDPSTTRQCHTEGTPVGCRDTAASNTLPPPLRILLSSWPSGQAGPCWVFGWSLTLRAFHVTN